MTIGGALFLIAIGAVLRYAIVDRADDVNLYTLGGILMWIGVIGLIIGIVLALLDGVRMRRRRPVDDRW
jgi:membrane associated rhomboid family serine protease